jgi:hypothetical protein
MMMILLYVEIAGSIRHLSQLIKLLQPNHVLFCSNIDLGV